MAESKTREAPPDAPERSGSAPLSSARATAECPPHLRARAAPENAAEAAPRDNGVMPSLGVDLLLALVRAFEFNSLESIVFPMRQIGHAAEFEPMSLWGAATASGAQSDAGRGGGVTGTLVATTSGWRGLSTG